MMLLDKHNTGVALPCRGSTRANHQEPDVRGGSFTDLAAPTLEVGSTSINGLRQRGGARPKTPQADFRQIQFNVNGLKADITSKWRGAHGSKGDLPHSKGTWHLLAWQVAKVSISPHPAITA